MRFIFIKCRKSTLFLTINLALNPLYYFAWNYLSNYFYYLPTVAHLESHFHCETTFCRFCQVVTRKCTLIENILELRVEFKWVQRSFVNWDLSFVLKTNLFSGKQLHSTLECHFPKSKFHEATLLSKKRTSCYINSAEIELSCFKTLESFLITELQLPNMGLIHLK